MENYSTNKTIFGLELSSNLLDKKIELLQVALVSPIVSEDLFKVLCQKLTNDELTEDKILKNIQTLKNNTTLCGEQLNVVINRINSYIETHQVSCEEIKILLDIKPELLEVFAHKAIKTAKDIFTLLKRNIFGQDQVLQSLSIFFYQWLSFWNSSKPNVILISDKLYFNEKRLFCVYPPDVPALLLYNQHIDIICDDMIIDHHLENLLKDSLV